METSKPFSLSIKTTASLSGLYRSTASLIAVSNMVESASGPARAASSAIVAQRTSPSNSETMQPRSVRW
ncbi:MAG: hypothetical protein IPL89_17355 [Acidobacteria bacterium]|nr:hypothetical protein [Acidobacteriota bacterium]